MSYGQNPLYSAYYPVRLLRLAAMPRATATLGYRNYCNLQVLFKEKAAQMRTLLHHVYHQLYEAVLIFGGSWGISHYQYLGPQLHFQAGSDGCNGWPEGLIRTLYDLYKILVSGVLTRCCGVPVLRWTGSGWLEITACLSWWHGELGPGLSVCPI